MSAQGIYILKPIANEKVFDNLCETLEVYNEEHGVEIVSPTSLRFDKMKDNETELVLSASEEVLEDIKEELESQDLIDSASIVDSFEGNFGEENPESDYEDDI